MQKKLRSVKKIIAKRTGDPDRISAILKEVIKFPVSNDALNVAADIWATVAENTPMGYQDTASIQCATVMRYATMLAEEKLSPALMKK